MTQTCTGQTVKLISDDVLTIGTDFAYPPFAFDHPDTGKPSGFDVELSQAVAKQLGLKILLVNRTSAAIVPGLLAQRHDLAASALVDTEELREEVCVSSPYLGADLGLGARSGTPPSVASVERLGSRAVGVVRGSRAERWARRNLPTTTTLVRVATSDDLITALSAKQVDGVIDDLPILQYTQLEADDFVVVEPIDTEESYVIAGGPENGGLIALVNEALSKLRTNGELAALRAKWFGE